MFLPIIPLRAGLTATVCGYRRFLSVKNLLIPLFLIFLSSFIASFLLLQWNLARSIQGPGNLDVVLVKEFFGSLCCKSLLLILLVCPQ